MSANRLLGLRCKGTTKFAHLQEKSHFLVIFCSAGKSASTKQVAGIGSRDSRDGNPSSGG